MVTFLILIICYFSGSACVTTPADNCAQAANGNQVCTDGTCQCTEFHVPSLSSPVVCQATVGKIYDYTKVHIA